MLDYVDKLKERFREDSKFRAMAIQLQMFMEQQEVQPYEVRDAAFIAELLYREKNINPLIVDSRYLDRNRST